MCIKKWGEGRGVRKGEERGKAFFTPPEASPPIYLSLVVEGFVCINNWGEGGRGSAANLGLTWARTTKIFYFI